MAVIANRIVIGERQHPILTFENPQIKEVTSDASVSLVGEELYIDQFTPTVDYELILSYLFSPVDYLKFKSSDDKVLATVGNYDLRRLPYGTKITFYSGDRVVGEFFSKKVDRIGKTLYKINATSAIGLLDKQYHKGNLYTGQFFPDVLQEILGGLGVNYTYDHSIASQRVFGWLPYDTKRNNLYQLLFAYGVSIIRSNQGQMLFTYIQDDDPITIPDSRVFSGGSVAYNDPASVVEVTEHSYRYLKNVDEVTLYDNSSEDYVDHAFVTFNEPIYPNSIRWKENTDEAIDDPVECYIHERGVNYAVISGLGQLVGKPYTHTVSILSATNPDSDVEKIVKVEDATLVTVLNSENVLARLSEYYFHATVVNQDLLYVDEKVGKRYRMRNSFGEIFTGYISKMSSRVSSFTRSSCEIIQGYTPVGMGMNYEHEAVLSIRPGVSEPTWTIPASVFEKEKPIIHITLIGKGENGSQGEPGHGSNNTVIDQEDYHKGCEGGVGGAAGRGGKVYSVTLDVSAMGATELRFSFNSVYNHSYTGGSDVNVYNSSTSIAFYSSSWGKSSSYGFYDPFSGINYALPGIPGVSGAKGGDSGKNSKNASAEEMRGQNGEDIIIDGMVYGSGGRGAYSRNFYGSDGSFSKQTVVSGAGGGGAAYGVSAPNAPEPTDPNASYQEQVGGSGGTAADPQPTSSVYGSGGNGGHGGGGAGGGSRVRYHLTYYDDENGFEDEGEYTLRPGYGGEASYGTLGEYGCAIIFY